jgi:hypothetical protein
MPWQAWGMRKGKAENELFLTKLKSEPQNQGKANRRTREKRTAEPKNIECRMSKDGIASGFAFGYDPTGRSLFF